MFKKPSVTREFHNQMKKMGVEVTNPILDPTPSLLYKGPTFTDEKESSFRFTHDKTTLEKIKSQHQKFKSANLLKGAGVDIFGAAQTQTWKNKNPHLALQNWMKTIEMDDPSIMMFDIETLGDPEEDFFTPTEIAFREFGKTDEGLRSRDVWKSTIVSPDTDTFNKIKDMLTRTKRTIEQGKSPELKSTQRRTIADLMKYYQEGTDADAKISKTKDGRIILDKASEIYKDFVDDTTGYVDLGTSEPVDKALKGLEVLQEEGADPLKAAFELRKFANEQLNDDNVFLMGHNIEEFDFTMLNEFFKKQEQNYTPSKIKEMATDLDMSTGKVKDILNDITKDDLGGFKFANKNYIDSYHLMSAVYPSIMSMQETGLLEMSTEEIESLEKGYFKMETLTKMLNEGEYTHTAFSDTGDAAKVIGKMLYSKEGIRFIQENVMKHGGMLPGDFKGYGFDPSPLKKGDNLFSIRQARALDDDLSYKTTPQGEVKSSTQYIQSHAPYEFRGSFEEEGKFGAVLKNQMTGEESYILKDSPKELRNFMYERFMDASAFDRQEIQDAWNYAREDTTRRNIAKLTERPSFGRWFGVKSMFKEAVETEKEYIKQYGPTKGHFMFLEEAAPDIFKYEEQIEHYSRAADRLHSEYEFTGKLIDKIETEGKKRGWSAAEKHTAFVHSYKEMQKEYGEMIEEADLPFTKEYGFKIGMPSGKTAKTVNLFSVEKAKADLNFIMSKAKDQSQRNIPASKNFLDEVLTRLRSEAQKIDDPKVTKQITEQLGSIKGALDSQAKTGSVVEHLAHVLVRHREDLDILSTDKLSVSGLSVTGAFDDPQKKKELIGKVDDYAKVGFDRVATTGLKIDRKPSIFGLDSKNKLQQRLNLLDEHFKNMYKSAGFKSEVVENIDFKSSIQGFIDDVRGKSLQGKANIGLGIYDSGTAEQPQLSLALFEAKSPEDVQAMATKDLAEIKKDAALIDIPLPSHDQMIKYGKSTKISPLLYLDRADEKIIGGTTSPKKVAQDVKIETSLDKILDQLRFRLGIKRPGEADFVESFKKGQFGKIEKMAHKGILEGLEQLSGPTEYIDDPEKFDATGTFADMFKKRYISLEGVFTTTQGDMYTLEGEEVTGPTDKMSTFGMEHSETTGGLREAIMKEVLGVEGSLEGTRGDHAYQGFHSLLDPREFMPLGYFDSPGRPNILQKLSAKPIDKEAIDGLSEMVSKGGSITMSDLFMTSTEKKAKEAFGAKIGVKMPVAFMKESDIVKGLLRATEKTGYELDYETGGSIPTTWEDQWIFSEELKGELYSTREITKDSPMLADKPKLVDKVKAAVDSEGEGGYKLGYQEDFLVTEGDKAVTFDKTADYEIVDYTEEDGVITDYTLKETTTLKESTKAFLGLEKGTAAHFLPQEVIEEMAGRKGVMAIGGPGLEKHKTYGMAARGLVNDALRQINKSDLEQKQKRLQVERIKSITEGIFKFKTSVVSETDADGSVVHTLVTKSGGFDTIPKESIAGLSTKLSAIDAVDIDERILTLDFAFGQDTGTLNFKSIGGFGKKGVKFGPRHVRYLESMGAEEHAEWLKDSIISGTPDELIKTLRGQKEAFDALTKIGPQRGAEGYFTLHDIVTQFEELPKGEYKGTQILGLDKKMEDLPTHEIAKKGKRGLYTDEDLVGTFFGGKTEGITVELPEGINVETKEGTKPISSLYLSKPYVESTDTGDRILTDVAKQERRILENLRDFNKLQQEQDELPDRLKGLSTEDVKGRIEKSVQGYYDKQGENLLASGGEMREKAVSQRIGGSAQQKLQVKTPKAELAASVKKKQAQGMAYDDAVSSVMRESGVKKDVINDAIRLFDKSGLDPFEEMTTVNISKQRAESLIKGAPEGLEKELQRRIDTGEKIPGLIHRSPVNYQESITPTMFVVDEGLAEEQLKISATEAALKRGDADGDLISVAMVYNREEDVTEEQAKQFLDNMVSETVETGKYGPMDKARQGVVEDLAEQAGQKTGAGFLGEEDLKQFTIDARGEEYLANLTEQKLNRAAYTGALTNLVQQFERVGKEYLDTTAEQSAYSALMGTIIDEPIDAKHGDKATYNILSSSIRQGDIELLKQEGIIEDKAQEHAVRKAYDKMGKGKLKSMVDESDKLLQSGIDTSPETVDTALEGTDSTEKRMVREILGVEQQKQQREVEKEKVTADTKNILKKAKQANIQEAAESLTKAGKGGLGKLGIGAAIVGGFMAGNVATSGRALPMDYMNEPAMQPVGDTGNRQAHMDMNNVEEIMKRHGMDISVEGQTTIDREPEELAGVVSEAVQASVPMPVDINVNSNDNRNKISQQWLEEQIINTIT